MGAEQFRAEARGVGAEDAFFMAREQAFYDHGHSGYTGTIAEKSEYEIFDDLGGLSPEEFVYALERDDETNPAVAAASSTYNDTWGPCVAILVEKYVDRVSQLDTQHWIFCGWASS